MGPFHGAGQQYEDVICAICICDIGLTIKKVKILMNLMLYTSVHLTQPQVCLNYMGHMQGEQYTPSPNYYYCCDHVEVVELSLIYLYMSMCVHMHLISRLSHKPFCSSCYNDYALDVKVFHIGGKF